MTTAAASAHDHGTDARIAAQLVAIGCGAVTGAALQRGNPEAIEAWLKLASYDDTRAGDVLRVPLGISGEALSGGLDHFATLASGRTVLRPGLLSRVTHGAPVLISTAERWTTTSIAQLWSAIETRNRSLVGRDARLVVVALDGSVGDDDRPPSHLLDRLAFLVRLDGVQAEDLRATDACRGAAERARATVQDVTVDDVLITALLACGAALGVDNARIDAVALASARAHAALMARSNVTEEDIAVAARLVYAPRATRYPAPATQENSVDTSPPPGVPTDARSGDVDPERRDTAEPDGSESAPFDLGEHLLQAARAALPEGLLSMEAGAPARSQSNASQGRAHGKVRPARTGRCVGVRRGDPRHDGPLDLIATVLAAAPWQTLRARWHERVTASAAPRRRLLVLSGDLRVKAFKHRTSCTTIFAVDASGSAALARMAEAKGAVELLLGECYVRRDRVGMVAFRGTSAEVLLTPTRSLTRARRSLSALPGGGATPLASGIDTARELATAVRRAGDAALLVMLTDGHANIDREGRPDRRRAGADALAAARSVRADRLPSVLIDISPRPGARTQDVAREMAARYVALPGADASLIHGAVRAAGAQLVT